jgi:long-chain fatty acid transport protein
VNDAVTVRAGANLASNPIPDKYVHPLFPATIENHYTVGLGYKISDASEVNASLAYAPEVSVTNSNTDTEINHSQTNWQLMYSHRF